MEPKTIALPKNFLYVFEFVLYGIVFAVPFLISGPQLLTGTLVNYVFFMYAVTFPKKNILPIAILPSIAALGNGLLFGLFTPFLLYFLPFIWMGNIILIKIFRYFYTEKSVIKAIGISSCAKVLFLFFVASIYFYYDIVPRMFLNSMGLMQLYTSLAGGGLAFLTLQLMKKKYE